MARKKADSFDPFAILNEEFGDAPKQQAPSNDSGIPAPSSEPELSAPSPSQQTDVREDSSEEKKTGCGGHLIRALFIIGLAVALAWIIFMPSGSLAELKDHTVSRAKQYASSFASQNASRWSQAAGSGDGEPTEISERITTAAVGRTTATTATSQATTAPTQTTTATSTTAATTTTATTTTTKAAATTTKVTTTTTQANTPATARGITGDISFGYVYVYLKSQVVVAYDKDGGIRRAFVCSSGKAATPTNTGEYVIRSKYRWRLMIGNCYTQYASSFSTSYLFHSIPYNRRNAATMSNTAYDKLGTPASSGCVRLCFRDAKWIYDNCTIGSPVMVVDETVPPNIATQPIIPRNTAAAYSGWDPTDDAIQNPYNQ